MASVKFSRVFDTIAVVQMNMTRVELITQCILNNAIACQMDMQRWFSKNANDTHLIIRRLASNSWAAMYGISNSIADTK